MKRSDSETQTWKMWHSEISHKIRGPITTLGREKMKTLVTPHFCRVAVLNRIVETMFGAVSTQDSGRDLGTGPAVH